MRASLHLDKGDLILTSPYHRGLVEDLKASIPYHDRQWDKGSRTWRIKYMWGSDVAAMVKRYLGEEIQVPKQMTQAQTGPIIRMFKVEYIGSVRERDDGSQTASGFCDGGWNLILPLAILTTWFGDESRPDEMPSLYAVLGCKPKATAEEIKKAYRLAARTWHPDVNKDPDAQEQFIRIQAAYETLSDGQQRRKYDAGLSFERDYNKHAQRRKQARIERYGYAPPVRCGWLTCEGQESLGRFTVSKILAWTEIQNDRGETMVSIWPRSAKSFITEWI